MESAEITDGIFLGGERRTVLSEKRGRVCYFGGEVIELR